MISISPKYNFSKLKAGRIQDKIDVFEDQMTGWLLAHAKALASPQYPSREAAGFAILTLLSGYFEGIASYLLGQNSEGKSAKFFAAGFLNVFPQFETQAIAYGVADPQKQLEYLAREYYREVRCA